MKTEYNTKEFKNYVETLYNCTLSWLKEYATEEEIDAIHTNFLKGEYFEHITYEVDKTKYSHFRNELDTRVELRCAREELSELKEVKSRIIELIEKDIEIRTEELHRKIKHTNDLQFIRQISNEIKQREYIISMIKEEIEDV